MLKKKLIIEVDITKVAKEEVEELIEFFSNYLESNCWNWYREVKHIKEE